MNEQRILNPDQIKFECIKYIGNNNLKVISYNELYEYLTVELYVFLPEEKFFSGYTYNNLLFDVLQQIAHFFVKDLKRILGDIVDADKKIEFVNKTKRDKFQVLDSAIKSYKDFLDNLDKKEKDKETFHLTKKNYYWALAGIIAGIVFAIAEIGISYYDIWHKDHNHETRMIELDSMQVEQNKQLIEIQTKQYKLDSINYSQPKLE